MNVNLTVSESTISKCEEFNDPSVLLLSPDTSESTAHATPSASARPAGFPDLNCCGCINGFPQEVDCMEYLQPLGAFHREAYASSEMEDLPILPLQGLSCDDVPSVSGYVEEAVTCQKVVQIKAERKTSIVTTVCESSIDEASLYQQRVRKMSEPSLYAPSIHEFRSVKICIGAFNSVEQCSVDLRSVAAAAKMASRSLNVCQTKAAPKHCCNCKKSRCLKLYCECFANGGFCVGCNCVDCLNTAAHAKAIEEARLQVSEKNPVAFKRRISEESETKAACCNCSKSGCLKKYCECYKNGQKCGSGCNCTGCKNTAALRTIAYKRCEKISRKYKHVVFQHVL